MYVHLIGLIKEQTT